MAPGESTLPARSLLLLWALNCRQSDRAIATMQRPTAALLLLLALAGVASARDLSAPARALAQVRRRC